MTRRLGEKATLLLLSLLVVLGCKSAPVIQPLSDANSWTIPIEAAVVEATGSDEGRQETTKTDEEEPDLVIVVPASATPTPVHVKRKKQTVGERVKEAMTNAPGYDVKSENQGVKAYQPKKTLWTRWLVLILSAVLVLAVVVMVVIRKLSSWSPWGWVVKILSWFR